MADFMVRNINGAALAALRNRAALNNTTLEALIRDLIEAEGLAWIQAQEQTDTNDSSARQTTLQ